nr:MAG TPA: hypothetical protein [Caudoviricetes sp.]
MFLKFIKVLIIKYFVFMFFIKFYNYSKLSREKVGKIAVKNLHLFFIKQS